MFASRTVAGYSQGCRSFVRDDKTPPTIAGMVPPPEIAKVAQALLDRRRELSEGMADRIQKEVDFYGAGGLAREDLGLPASGTWSSSCGR
jgi:hypothetical protein